MAIQMQAQVLPLERKRADVLIRIAQQGLGTGIAGTVPTPALELTKQLGIALSDAWMFWDIYKIYYNEELSAQRLRELLSRARIIVLTGGVIGYGAVRLSQSLISEVLNFVPVAGWVVSGLLSGSTSVAVGLAWMLFVEDSYRNKYQLAEKPVKFLPEKTSQEDVLPARFGASSNGAEPATRKVKIEISPALSEVPEGEILDEAATEQASPMAADEKIQIEHPDPGKEGVNIDSEKYWVIREGILNTLRAAGPNAEMALKDINQALEAQLPDFDGAIPWYVTTVKLDLEAKKLIERVPKKTPQHIRLLES